MNEEPPPVRAPFDMAGYPGVPLTDFTWRFWMVAVIAAASVVPLLWFGLFVASGSFDPLASDTWRFVVSIIPYVFGVGTAWLVVRLLGGRPLDSVGLRPFAMRAGVVAAVVGAVFGRILTVQVSSWLVLLGLDPSGVDQYSSWGDSVFGLGSMALIALVIAPFAEEFLFRGVLLTWLRERWGTAVGVTVSSALFGAMHMSVLLAVPMALVGVVLAWLYLSTRSLWVPIVAHGLFNLGGFAAYLLLRQVGMV